jgi:hypothetical protein
MGLPMAKLEDAQPTLFGPPNHEHIKQLSSYCATLLNKHVYNSAGLRRVRTRMNDQS